MTQFFCFFRHFCDFRLFNNRKMIKEQELVSLCREENRVGFSALFNQYASTLMGICFRYTGNEEDAREVFQEGFKKIIELFGSFEFRGEGSLKAWMSKMMINAALAYIKKKRREEDRREPLSDNHYEEPFNERIDLNSVPDDVIRNFISSLPSGCRTVLNMYLFEGLDHTTIANSLKISSNASAARLYRARVLLEGMIKNYLKQTE